MSQSDVILYALGGGFGHTVRACLLASAIERHGASATVLLPHARQPLAALLGARAWPITRSDDASALRARVDDALRRLAPSQLVVDALPAGVLGELSTLPAVPRRTLLLRLHKRLDTTGLDAFDDVIDLEAHLAWRPSAIRASSFAPVAREPAQVDRSSLVDVALLAGADERMGAFFERLAPRLRAHGCRVVVARGAPRAREALDGRKPRVVVGAAGYNLVYEAARAGVWHVAIPRARAFDDQRRRAEAMAEVAAGPRDLERRVLARLDEGARPHVVEAGSFDALAARVLDGSARAALSP